MKEDFNALYMISHMLVMAPFMEQWQWRVRIVPPAGIETYGLFARDTDSGVTDFDLLAKGIDHDPVTIESEPVKAGAITFNFPTTAGPSTINLTMRDSLDDNGLPRFYRFFKSLTDRVINSDGTVNLSKTYLLNLYLQSLAKDNPTIEKYKVFAQKLGNFSASVDGEGLVEYPVTFMQFRSLG
jgi:hypothetical protein